MIGKLSIFMLGLVLILQINSSAGQESSRFPPLKNKDVVELLKTGLSAEVVIAKIKTTACNFDTSPDALKQLKADGVADAVILAMVQAPVAAPQKEREAENDSVSAISSTKSTPPSAPGYAKCGEGGKEVSVLASPPTDLRAVAKLVCNEQVTLLAYANGFFRVRTNTGAEGFISHWFVEETTTRWSPSSSTQTSSSTLWKSAANALPTNAVRALGYRVVPQQNTTYYRSGGYSSHTNCYSGGTWTTFGSFGSLNLNTNCDTTYSTPTDIPITWQFADVYNLVESNSKQYVIHCRANWRWSKCSPLIPGDVFEAEVKGSDLWVVGSRDGKKQVKVKYGILQAMAK